KIISRTSLFFDQRSESADESRAIREQRALSEIPDRERFATRRSWTARRLRAEGRFSAQRRLGGACRIWCAATGVRAVEKAARGRRSFRRGAEEIDSDAASAHRRRDQSDRSRDSRHSQCAPAAI